MEKVLCLTHWPHCVPSVLLLHITWTHQLVGNICIWVSIVSYIRFQTYNCIWYSCIYKVSPFNRQKNAPSKWSSWIAVIMPKQVQWSVMRHCPKANEETCQEVLWATLQKRLETLSRFDYESIHPKLQSQILSKQLFHSSSHNGKLNFQKVHSFPVESFAVWYNT